MNKIQSLLLGIFIGCFTCFLPSCACWTDQAKENTAGCIVAHDVVDCTTGAVSPELPYFAGIVVALINGGMNPNNIPWTQIEQQAESMGIRDGGCFLAQLKNLLFSTPTASPEIVQSRMLLIHIFDDYKLKHFGTTSVKFKIKDKSGKVVEL